VASNRLVVILLALFVLSASAFLLALRALGRREDLMALLMCVLGALSIKVIMQASQRSRR